MNHTEVLVEMVQSHGWQSGAEIGVLAGRTFFALLDQCPKLKRLAGVDLWQTYEHRNEQGFHHYENHDMEGYYRTILERLQRPPYAGRGRVLRMDTVEASRFIPDDSLDFVFIDGDHTSPAVRRDLLAWIPKVKGAGWIVGDDTHFPSVKAVVDELLPGWITMPDHVWAIARRKVKLP